jgi:hypothetical protein
MGQIVIFWAYVHHVTTLLACSHSWPFRLYIYIYFPKHKRDNDNLTHTARKPAWALDSAWVKRQKKLDPYVTQMTHKMTQN